MASSSLRTLARLGRRSRPTVHSAIRTYSRSMASSANLHHIPLASSSRVSTSPWSAGLIRPNPPQTRSMFIQTETTPNEDSLKFIPGATVMGEDGAAEFLDTRSALASPLAIRLMGIQGVKAVFFGPDFVTVSKDSEQPWAIIKPEVYSTLMEFFSSGQSLFRSEEDRQAAGPQDTKILDTDSETVAMIKELLVTRVRPSIMEHGGDIEYLGFDDDGIVKLSLRGSCRGCDTSTVTLKNGIERIMMHYIPEVKGVEHVLHQEEEIALNEFAKLEKRLTENQSRSDPEPKMAKYMSV